MTNQRYSADELAALRAEPGYADDPLAYLEGTSSKAADCRPHRCFQLRVGLLHDEQVVPRLQYLILLVEAMTAFTAALEDK